MREREREEAEEGCCIRSSLGWSMPSWAKEKRKKAKKETHLADDVSCASLPPLGPRICCLPACA